MSTWGGDPGIGIFLAASPIFLTFFHDFATPVPHFLRRGVRIKTGGSHKGGPHFFLRGAAF